MFFSVLVFYCVLVIYRYILTSKIYYICLFNKILNYICLLCVIKIIGKLHFLINTTGVLKKNLIFVSSKHKTMFNNYDFSGKKILIAEDERTNYLFLEALLKRTNATLIWAETGKSALEAVPAL